MKTTKHFFTFIAFVILGMSVGIAQAAGVNYFLKIGDIAGGSVDNKHSAWIDIDSFSWGISNTSPIGHGGGGQVGKAVFSPFSWTQQLDKSAPPMFVAVASGKHYKNATLDVTRSGGKSSDVFFKMSFDDVLLSKIDIAGAGAIPGVAGALVYSRITMTYWAQKADGSLDTPVIGGWDLNKNAPVFFGSPVALQGLFLAAPTASAVPVPAAAWLFGSGLIGLVGVARRSTARKEG